MPVSQQELRELISREMDRIRSQYPVMSDYAARTREIPGEGLLEYERKILYRDEEDPNLLKEWPARMATKDTEDYPQRWSRLSFLPADTRQRWSALEGKTIYHVSDYTFDPALRPFSAKDVLPSYDLPVQVVFRPTQLGFPYDYPPLDEATGRPTMTPIEYSNEIRKVFRNAFFFYLHSRVPWKYTTRVIYTISVSFTTPLRYRVTGLLRRAVLSPYEAPAYALLSPSLGYLTLNLTLFQTGARIGEILNMQRSFVDFDNNTITFRVEKKRGAVGVQPQRSVSLKPVVMQLLKMWVDSGEHEDALRRAQAGVTRQFVGDVFPFPYNTARQMLSEMAYQFGIGLMEEPDPGDYRQGLVAFSEREYGGVSRLRPNFRAVRHFGPHVFRASYITNLYLVDRYDILKIARIVGHVDTKTTTRYIAKFLGEKGFPEVARAKTFEEV